MELTVKDVALALYNGNIQTRFGRTQEEGNDLVRKAILKAAGCEDGWDYYKFQHNKYLVFKILSEILDETIGQSILNQYNAWIDFRSVPLGDITEFIIPNHDLFEVGIVANGTDSLRRQRILQGKLQMDSFQLGLKIYDEFMSMISNKIDWSEMVKRIALSVDNAIMKIIIKQVEQAYGGQGNGKYNFTGSYDDAKLVELITNVEAKTGLKAKIYGNKMALANLRQGSAANWAEADKMDIRNQGHVGLFNGTPVVEIPNFMDKNDNLVLSQNHLFIVPDGTKMVKLVYEGNAEIHEVTDQHARLDHQQEYQFIARYQLAVVKSNCFGVFEIA